MLTFLSNSKIDGSARLSDVPCLVSCGKDEGRRVLVQPKVIFVLAVSWLAFSLVRIYDQDENLPACVYISPPSK